MRNRKQVQESSWSQVGGLVLVKDGAGFHNLLDILVQGLPPELSLEKFFGPLYPWVAGERRTVAQLEDLGSELGCLFGGRKLRQGDEMCRLFG